MRAFGALHFKDAGVARDCLLDAGGDVRSQCAFIFNDLQPYLKYTHYKTNK